MPDNDSHLWQQSLAPESVAAEPPSTAGGFTDRAANERRPGETPMRGWFLVRWWRSFVLEPLRQADEEARLRPSGGGKVVTVLVTVAVMLTLQHYLMGRELPRTRRLLQQIGLTTVAGWLDTPIGWWLDERRSLAYWAALCVVTYFVIPAVIVRFVFREKLSDYGLKLRGAFADGWIYVAFFAVVGPLVLLVSREEHFQATYPFYHLDKTEPLWPHFWAWEALYATQFFALEFFFRGFMVHGLRRRLGASAIPVMMVPYCMIHFEKPLPETFAAIIAGLVLGFMSLRTRSIILGAVIHVSVALSMDFTSLWRKGFFD
jgi:membrane protease YdiL (CAAX protease family)